MVDYRKLLKDPAEAAEYMKKLLEEVCEIGRAFDIELRVEDSQDYTITGDLVNGSVDIEQYSNGNYDVILNDHPKKN